MAKKRKSLNNVTEELVTEELGEGETFVGTPTMVLLPARNYYFRVLNTKFSITIPREGTYYDLDPKFYTAADKGFLVLDADAKALDVTSISKVLFGVHKYPDLAPNQLFAPALLRFKEKEVEIIGQLIEILDPTNQ